jgi:hypothetical protein
VLSEPLVSKIRSNCPLSLLLAQKGEENRSMRGSMSDEHECESEPEHEHEYKREQKHERLNTRSAPHVRRAGAQTQ